MNNSPLLALPAELRSLKQWILWKYEDKGGKKPTKVPYSIKGYLADVTDNNTWSSFDEVFNVFAFGNYDGVGFVFSDSDPYAFIDLDECSDTVDHQRQIKIYNEFDSYSEISPSGKGLHIIVKGKIPQGRRRSNIEIYSSERYATMTGNVYSNKPIAERGELLNLLFNQMGRPPKVYNYDGNDPETEPDDTIIERASSASNGDKFRELLQGEWNSLYGSQSEADFAFIDIVAFYTQNRNQIARIFRNSQLGKRAKAQRKDYVEWMINKSFDRLLPKIDFDGFRVALEEKLANEQRNNNIHNYDADSNINGNIHSVVNRHASVAQLVEPAAHNSSGASSNLAASTIQPPQGLVGEIAQFIYQAAPRPVPEIAIAAAIGLMAGICGKAYNISGTGLNQYIMCIAMTGAGKEAMASGIDKIINEVQKQVPVAPEFIGPSRIASGQALYKYMSAKSQCFVSIIGEFGKRLEAMSGRNANSAEKQLIAELLDLYNKSGHGQTSKPSIYSDQDKNTLTIQAPSLSILGESTPDTFYSVLNEDMISDGLLPRFMLIEYNGPRPALNENHINTFPSQQLVNKVSELMANAKTIMASRKVINIERSQTASKMLADFDRLADSKINTTDKETVRQLWNRAHIKVLKISGLIAVGRNYVFPTIEDSDVEWAMQIVEHDIRALSTKFESGEIGKSSDEIKQIKDIKRILVKYAIEDCPKIADKRMHSNKVITSSFLSSRLYSMASIRKDLKVSQKVAVDRAIKIMVEYGWLIEVPGKRMTDLYGTTAKGYQLGPMVELMKEDG